MIRLPKPRWSAPLIHGYFFLLTWVLAWLQPQPLLDGPSRWPFALIVVGDFPFSVFAFGAMFVSDKNFPYALAAWGIIGSLWWYFLGRLIEDGRAVGKTNECNGLFSPVIWKGIVRRSKVLRVNATAITGIVLIFLAVGLSTAQTAPYRIVNGQTDSHGFPTTPAKICVNSASDQCYSPPSPKAPLPPFGLNATAKNLELSTGVILTVFTAESSSGGSGSFTSIALLEDRNGKWLNLLPIVTVTNQSEYRFWNLPTVSAMPILITADFLWGEGETHFAPHRYRITSYVYHRQGGRYVQRDEYVTERKYDGLDDATEIKVLEQEKAAILRRLGSG